jgi:hypothetical protein
MGSIYSYDLILSQSFAKEICPRNDKIFIHNTSSNQTRSILTMPIETSRRRLYHLRYTSFFLGIFGVCQTFFTARSMMWTLTASTPRSARRHRSVIFSRLLISNNVTSNDVELTRISQEELFLANISNNRSFADE